MYVERDIGEYFDKIASLYKIIAVVGARQSGKTTLLKKKLSEENGNYVTLDDPDAREIFNEDIKKFEKQYLQKETVTGIDEVQYGKDAGQKLKYLADTGYDLWVTSSSETLLGKDVLSYLVGRVSILKLYPFSLNEFKKAKGIREAGEKQKKRTVWEHAVYGGYPKAVLTQDIESKKIILKDLTDTMLLKDVSKTFSIQDLDKLEKLSIYLANNAGKMVSYEKITDSLEMSYSTLKKYLAAMEKSYILKTLKPFHTNKNKELVKKPKIYFIDTGLRNSILRKHPEKLDGQLFENYVLTELMKTNHEIKYWRTKNKTEVDFIVEKDHSLIPIEVKKKTNKIPSGLKTFIDTYKPTKAYVVHIQGTEKNQKLNGCTIHFVNIYGLIEGIGKNIQ